MLGVLEDVERRLTIAPSEGDTLVLLGADLAQPAATLAGSEWQSLTLGALAGRPHIDLDLEARVQRLVLDAHARGLLTAAHDCADGGLAVTLAECCIAADAGLDSSALDLGPRLDAALFGEAQSRFVVGTRDADALLALATETGVPATVLGPVGGDRVRLGPVDLTVAELRDVYEGALPAALAGVDAQA